MARFVPSFVGSLIAFVLVASPWVYSTLQQRHIRHFRCVREGVLYRSGQLSLSGLQRIIHDYGIRSVVTLRDAYTSGESVPDQEEEDYCRTHGIRHFRITPREWSQVDGNVPAERGVAQFLAVMDNSENYPVLVHCFAGIHRTGAHCAIYRMEFDRWSNREAIEEMKRCGYANLDNEANVLGYLESYRPRWASVMPEKRANPLPCSAGSGAP
jgi:protein tyrosine/serine phosphatase